MDKNIKQFNMFDYLGYDIFKHESSNEIVIDYSVAVPADWAQKFSEYDIKKYVADNSKTGLVYPYLINQNDNDYLVLLCKGKLLSKKLNNKFVEKSIVIDGYKYSKSKNNKLK